MLTLSTPLCKNLYMPQERAGTQGERHYHHGNLRASLIEVGLELIEEKGVRAFTLRELGARAGVSRMAPYRHFRNKADLLGAIREAGFNLFANALEAARSSGPDTFESRHTAMALAYVRFAAEHPAYFEVMFSWADEPAGKDSGSSVAGERAFGILEETIRQGQQSGEVRPGDSVMLARMVWAQVHGISVLRLDGGAAFVQFSSAVLLTGLKS
jgi:AcrR family transcriptional regulator